MDQLNGRRDHGICNARSQLVPGVVFALMLGKPYDTR